MEPQLAAINLQTLTGPAIQPYLPALARLRINVFRDFPYLYAGSLDYEQRYLTTYLASEGAALIIAKAGDEIIGASTCLKLATETPNIQKPFLDHGMDVTSIMYFGESVLEPAYRGQGIGVKFFAAREAHAKNFSLATFCAVNRPPDHPARPKNYMPLDNFWHKRGFAKQEHLTCEMEWTDIGHTTPTSKTLTFWVKTL
jgi:GNAT superfamily N-acetyltransferase